MKPTGLIDLHCDTLTAFMNVVATPREFSEALVSDEARAALLVQLSRRDTLDDPAGVLSLSKMPAGTKWAQMFAVFIPDECRGQTAVDYFDVNCTNFHRQMDKFSDRVMPCRNASDLEAAFSAGKFAAILTIEGGAALAGDLSRVARVAGQGVRAVTLVWNGENEIGSGNKTDKGLTAFGRAVIPELERHGVLVDVSHLNDAGFYDLLEVARKPFMATHSNARAVAPHKRNLTDGQIDEMVRRECLIGLNFYVAFLREDREVKSLDDLYRHACHFLDRGAGRALALGSDYDGAALPDCLNSVEKSLTIYDYFLSRGLPEQTADDILFGNAWRFFRQNLK